MRLLLFNLTFLTMLHTPLFSPKFLADAAKTSTQELTDLQEHALPIVREWQESLRSGALAATKEEQLQTDFLEAFFAKMLGYESSRGAAIWNLEKEQKNVTDSQKADGALGFFTMKEKVLVADVRAVIELKGAKSDLDKPQNRKEDKRTPVEQAFAYGSKTGGKCRWVIVSNVVEIRLYHVTDQSRYERFELKTLHESAPLQRFLFLLHRARLINSTNPNEKSELDALHEQRKEQERTISNEFYGKYKAARQQLFEHLKERNPAQDELFLLQKAQKLLDRLLFVFFCEDLNLLPRQTAFKVIQNAKQSFSAEEGEIWRQLRGLFLAIDKGNPPNNISKFNGGLFAADAEMDALSIADSQIESLLQFSEYDFDSDLNVRILGHIFEQSVSDIEELKTQIEMNKGACSLAEKTVGKRKRDGIFYTPEYITRFIVQNTVGAYLEERKQECGFAALPELGDDDLSSISINKGILKANKRIESHIAAWSAYREHVRTVRVCDPACGSGAFLIEVFDFLYAEGQRVNAELSRLRGGQTEVFDLEKHILTRNIFGVDVNAEAVEITKLALWLKTANKGKELTDLDGNIKCGNSLVDDPRVAGAAAFDWQVQFASVMEQGGFDVIVGNPPYVDIKALPNELVKHFFSKFTTASNRINLYSLFLEKALHLQRDRGYLSFIIPNSLLLNSSYKLLREQIIGGINTIIKMPDNVFEEANVETIIITYQKSKQHSQVQTVIHSNDEVITEIDLTRVKTIEKSMWANSADFGFNIYSNNSTFQIIQKSYLNSIELGNVASFSLGITPYDKYQGHDEITIKQRLFHAKTKLDDLYKPLIAGENITRFNVTENVEEYIKYGEWLGAAREERFFTEPRIIIRQIVSGNPPRIFAGYTDAALFFTQIGFAIIPNNTLQVKYVLALLNSQLLNFIHKYKFLDIEKDVFQKILIANCKQLPIKVIPESDQQPFITHAETMLTTTRHLADLRKRVLTLLLTKTGIQKASTKLQAWDALTWAELEAEFRKAKVNLSLNDQEELLQYFEQKKAEVERLKTTLAATDHAIDGLVYELYGLTAEEIAVVEGK
ncbi:MAG: restriction endonuclease subunit M [Candidatus Kapaibacterium sp.]|nr:MAG: restriction endonuclease subunit M [Candidatus Kapabacteria bacterium]